MNLVSIASACAVECERQQVGLRELGYLLEGYQNVVDNGGVAFELASDFERIGRLIEPEKNFKGFRNTPVTFKEGGSSANPSEIPRLIQTLAANIELFANGGLNFVPRDKVIKHIVKEFLWIHPFADGNGRVAFLLLNYLLGTLDDPRPLPDFMFN